MDRDAPGENADVGLPEEDGSLCAFSGRLEAEPDGSLRRSPRDADVSPAGTVELEDRGAVDAVRPAQPEVRRAGVPVGDRLEWGLGRLVAQRDVHGNHAAGSLQVGDVGLETLGSSARWRLRPRP